ncbi:MAG: hypothetical protein LBU65_00730 [Planctomycetaceae bacterium]|jgi:hypothetical protein|nr:hypothetical protein [Planctomycetaceae bacterium]
MPSNAIKPHVWGFPRIRASRELKKSLEAYCQGVFSKDVLYAIDFEREMQPSKVGCRSRFVNYGGNNDIIW